MKYRSDIDGLRALAVLPVVFFHADMNLFSGGFVGVDVFFVISGYLITSIIARELAEDRFSIVNFYERRIRRIFPALFTTMFVSTIAAWFILFPGDFQTFSQSMVAATLFSSNILFFLTSGYFENASHNNALLHTWSLAVEEQFYIFFPILMILWAKFAAKRYLLWIIPLSLISFGWCVWLTNEDPQAAFYLPHVRAWELAVGSLLALGAFKATQNKVINELAGIAGFALILMAVFVYTKDTAFPGYAALAPVLGAALIIYAGETGSTGTIAGRILSLRPVVFIGLISYSLYLWHWPVMVFTKYVQGGEPMDLMTGLITTIVSIALAVVSWHFIERPFRTKDLLKTRIPLFGTAAVIMAVAIGFGLYGHISNGASQRLGIDPSVLAQQKELRTVARESYRHRQCFIDSEDAFSTFDREACINENGQGILLIGDSHAAHFYPGLQARFPNATISQINSGGCRGLKDTNTRATSRNCAQVIDAAFNELVTKGSWDMVILSSRWRNTDVKTLQETITHIQAYNNNVVLVGPGVEYRYDLPVLAAMGTAQDNFKAGQRTLDQELQELFKEQGITYISMVDLICPDGECKKFLDDQAPMQWDYGHLTTPASIWAVSQWDLPTP